MASDLAKQLKEGLKDADLSLQTAEDIVEKKYQHNLKAINAHEIREEIHRALENNNTYCFIKLHGYVPKNHPDFLEIKDALEQHPLIKRCKLVRYLDFEDFALNRSHKNRSWLIIKLRRQSHTVSLTDRVKNLFKNISGGRLSLQSAPQQKMIENNPDRKQELIDKFTTASQKVAHATAKLESEKGIKINNALLDEKIERTKKFIGSADQINARGFQRTIHHVQELANVFSKHARLLDIDPQTAERLQKASDAVANNLEEALKSASFTTDLAAVISLEVLEQEL